MIKTAKFSLLTLNKFNFGERPIHQFVVFEYKPIFSLIFFWFHRSSNVQDRFHTHAFNAISVKLFGRYTEHILTDESTGEYTEIERTEIFKYFPRDRYHRIAGSRRGCLTMLLSGPWKKTWKEYISGRVQTYSWTRAEV